MTREAIEQIKHEASGKTPLEIAAGGIDENGFFDCESRECAFNNGGKCRYSAVYGEGPVMTEEDGCLCGAFN